MSKIGTYWNGLFMLMGKLPEWFFSTDIAFLSSFLKGIMDLLVFR